MILEGRRGKCVYVCAHEMAYFMSLHRHYQASQSRSEYLLFAFQQDTLLTRLLPSDSRGGRGSPSPRSGQYQDSDNDSDDEFDDDNHGHDHGRNNGHNHGGRNHGHGHGPQDSDMTTTESESETGIPTQIRQYRTRE